MKDINKFIKLYKSFGIVIKRSEHSGKQFLLLGDDKSFDESCIGFYSQIVFDGKGKFISQGFYE